MRHFQSGFNSPATKLCRRTVGLIAVICPVLCSLCCEAYGFFLRLAPSAAKAGKRRPIKATVQQRTWTPLLLTANKPCLRVHRLQRWTCFLQRFTRITLREEVGSNQFYRCRSYGAIPLFAFMLKAENNPCPALEWPVSEMFRFAHIHLDLPRITIYALFAHCLMTPPSSRRLETNDG